MNCIDWFLCHKLTLHFLDKFHLVKVYYPFHILLNLTCKYFIIRNMVCIFFSCNILIWFWYQDYGSFVKWVRKYSLFYFGQKHLILIFFLESLTEFTSEVPCGKSLNCELDFFNKYRIHQIVLSPWIRFIKLYFSRNICIGLGWQIYWHSVSNISHYSFKVFRFHSDSPSSIPDTDNLCFLAFFFLGSLDKVFPILLTFSKN